jgi:hypothetical protein
MATFQNGPLLGTSNLETKTGTSKCMHCCADPLANPFSRHLHSPLNPTNLLSESLLPTTMTFLYQVAPETVPFEVD